MLQYLVNITYKQGEISEERKGCEEGRQPDAQQEFITESKHLDVKRKIGVSIGNIMYTGQTTTVKMIK